MVLQAAAIRFFKCSGQIYSEKMPVEGTPFDLVYESDRVPGYERFSTLKIPLVGSSFDSRILKVYVGVRVAGRDFQFYFQPQPALSQDFNLLSQSGDRYEYEFKPSANLAFPFTWDDKDLNGAVPVGPQNVILAVGYFYDSPYWTINSFGIPALASTSSQASPVSSRIPTLSWWKNYVNFTPIGPWDARGVGLGGWTLSAHHTYNPRTLSVEFGSGGHSPGARGVRVIQQVAGQCWSNCNFAQNDAGDNGPASNAYLANVNNFALGSDGSIYIAEGVGTYDSTNKLRKIDPSGIITTIAGGNGPVTPGGAVINSEGDGGLAVNAHFFSVQDVALGPEGSIYVADYFGSRIRKIDTNGIISTIAGNGTRGYGTNGEGGPATQTSINSPWRIAVGPDGSVYFSDQSRIQRITPDGILTAFAGIFNPSFDAPDPDEVPATQAVTVAYGIDVAADGTVYFADGGRNHDGRVRKVTPDGIIHAVPGLGPGGLESGVYIAPEHVALGRDGTIYTSTARNLYAIRDGVASILAGGDNPKQYACGADIGHPGVGTVFSIRPITRLR